MVCPSALCKRGWSKGYFLPQKFFKDAIEAKSILGQSRSTSPRKSCAKFRAGSEKVAFLLQRPGSPVVRLSLLGQQGM